VVLIGSNADLIGCYEVVRASQDEVARARSVGGRAPRGATSDSIRSGIFCASRVPARRATATRATRPKGFAHANGKRT